MANVIINFLPPLLHPYTADIYDSSIQICITSAFLDKKANNIKVGSWLCSHRPGDVSGMALSYLFNVVLTERIFAANTSQWNILKDLSNIKSWDKILLFKDGCTKKTDHGQASSNKCV